MSSPPDAALFDIGNVLVHLDFETALGRLVPPGVDDAQKRMRSLLEKKDDLETGAMTSEEFIPWASDRLGFTGPAERYSDSALP